MLQHYPSLVEAAIEFQVFTRKLLAEKQGDIYEVQPEDETTFFAGYLHL